MRYFLHTFVYIFTAKNYFIFTLHPRNPHVFCLFKGASVHFDSRQLINYQKALTFFTVTPTAMKPTTSASQVSLEHLSSATAAFKHSQDFLQGPTTNLFISDEKQHPEEVAQMPTLAMPPNFPSSEDKRQRSCPAAMSSQTFSLRNPTMCPPETTLKLDEITATEGFSAEATFKVDGAKDGQTSHTILPEAILKIEGATSDPNDVEATPASFVADEDYSGAAISHDEALAFLNCESDMTDEEIVRQFSRKVS
jgi:hypothetical protein